MGSLGTSEGNITGRKTETKNTQIMCLIATASREVAQMLKSAISKQGLDREVRAG